MLPATVNAPTPEPTSRHRRRRCCWTTWRDHQTATGRGNPTSDYAARRVLATLARTRSLGRRAARGSVGVAAVSDVAGDVRDVSRLAAAGMGLAGRSASCRASGARSSTRRSRRTWPVSSRSPSRSGSHRSRRNGPHRNRSGGSSSRPVGRLDQLEHRRSRRARRRVSRTRSTHGPGLAALSQRDRVRPPGVVPPRRHRHATQPAVEARHARGSIRRLHPGVAAVVRRVSGTQARHLSTQDGVEPRDPTRSLRPVPHRTRSRPRHARRTRSTTSHRALPELDRHRHLDNDRRHRSRSPTRTDASEPSNTCCPRSPNGAGPTRRPRRLIFRSDHPRLPRPLPRYLPVDADRRLTSSARSIRLPPRRRRPAPRPSGRAAHR